MITKRISFVCGMCGNIFTSALKLRKYVIAILGRDLCVEIIHLKINGMVHHEFGCLSASSVNFRFYCQHHDHDQPHNDWPCCYICASWNIPSF